MKYVWYLSYGSNMFEERFLCYIQGNKYKDNAKKEQGCRDNSLPIKAKEHMIENKLYFTKQSSRWQNMGVSFVEPRPSHHGKTYAKMYLITQEQFEDVVKQENAIDVNSDIVIDYDQLDKEESQLIYQENWYGLLLKIGEEDGYPMYTFTAPTAPNHYVKPSRQYLYSLLKGVSLSFNCSNKEIIETFMNYDGIEGHYTERELLELLED